MYILNENIYSQLWYDTIILNEGNFQDTINADKIKRKALHHNLEILGVLQFK